VNAGEPRLQLTDFVDVPTLQTLQDAFARLTGISIAIRDAAGKEITRPAGQARFCDLMNASPSGATACRESHREASRLVRMIDAAALHRCHAGLTRYVAPIVVRGQTVAKIMIGDRPVQALAESDVQALAKAHDVPGDALTEASDALPMWDPAEMEAATVFVQQLANTIARLCFQTYQLQCRIDDLGAVYDVSSKLAGQVELQEILDTATKQLVETMGLRAASIRLIDAESQTLRIRSVASLSAGYLDVSPVKLTESKIDLEALEGRTVYVRDVRADPRTVYKDTTKKEGLVSALVTALTCRGEKFGVLRAYMDRVYAFSPFDVALLEGIAAQVGAAIASARLLRDKAEAERLDRQVKLASAVQRRMIPAAPPTHTHYAFGCIYEPTQELGGDFYDFINLPNGDLGIAVADVVGKGVPASLVMASTRSTLRSYMKQVGDLGRVMQHVNLRLCNDTLVSEFVTAFVAILSADGRRLTYCNAGHEPLLVLRDGRLEAMADHELLLGVDRNATYRATTFELRPGDLLVVFTDGMPDAMNYDDASYGKERLHASIVKHGGAAAGLPVDMVAKQLLWDVRRFAGLRPMLDDISLVVTRVT